jgi:phosphohistidine phosphatase SixA
MDKHVKALVGLVLLLLSGCLSGRAWERPPEIYAMRHLAAEAGGDPGLTAEGARQARLLAGWFASRRPPRAIYVSTYKRSRETAAPLAARLRIEPTVYDPSDPEALVGSILRERGPVLVVGHSNTVPEIVERLGGARPAPIAHHEHGDIWRISGSPRAAQKLKLEP